MTTATTLFLLMLTAFCLPVDGRQIYNGNCAVGGTTIQTGGVAANHKVQASYPACTVTVYLTGTGNAKANIYSSINGTALANPFTANGQNGSFFFWADDGYVDVQLSGGGIASPVTIGSIPLFAAGAGVSFLGVLSGTLDGTNLIFYTQQPQSFIILQRNGQTLDPGLDYTLVGSTVTFIPPTIPQPGDVLAVYGSNSLLYLGVPSGAINGTNTVFAVGSNPGNLLLYLNGSALYPGVDFTLSGGTVTLIYAPQPGDVLIAYSTASIGNGITGGVNSGTAGQTVYYAAGGNTLTARSLTAGTAIQKADGAGWLTAAGPSDFAALPTAVYLNILQYGGVANSDVAGCPNDAAISAAFTAAIITGNPTKIIFPAGEWYQCSTYNPPPNVVLSGVSRWAQESEYAAVSGTVLKASPTYWAAGSTLQSTAQVFLGGNGGNDSYGSGVEYMHLDSSGVANGIYTGHVNETSGAQYVEALNYLNFGLFICGADNAGVCTYFGKPGENGAQVEGSFHDLIFASNDANGGTSSTVAIYLVNVTGDRAIKDATIVPHTGNPSNIPYAGVVMWGIKTTLDGIHVQNATRGIALSPTSGSLCSSACNGSISDRFVNIDLTQAPATNYVIDIQAATDSALSFDNITATGGSGATCVINYNLSNGYSGCITNNVTHFEIDGAGIPQSVENGLTLNSETVSNALLSSRGGFEWRGAASPFGTTATAQSNAGDLSFTGTGTSRTVRWSRSYYTFYIDSGTPFVNLNFNALGDTGSTGERSAISNNIHWDTASQTWLTTNNGGGDYASLGFGNGFTGISTGNGYGTGSTVTQAAYNANYAFITLNNGHSFAGKGIVNSSGNLAVTDNGAVLQTQGPQTAAIFGSGNSANTDQVGELNFASATSVSYSFTGTYSSHPECNFERQFDLGATPPRFWVTYSGTSSFTYNFSSAVSGVVGYTCHYRN